MTKDIYNKIACPHCNGAGCYGCDNQGVVDETLNDYIKSKERELCEMFDDYGKNLVSPLKFEVFLSSAIKGAVRKHWAELDVKKKEYPIEERDVKQCPNKCDEAVCTYNFGVYDEEIFCNKCGKKMVVSIHKHQFAKNEIKFLNQALDQIESRHNTFIQNI